MQTYLRRTGSNIVLIYHHTKLYLCQIMDTKIYRVSSLHFCRNLNLIALTWWTEVFEWQAFEGRLKKLRQKRWKAATLRSDSTESKSFLYKKSSVSFDCAEDYCSNTCVCLNVFIKNVTNDDFRNKTFVIVKVVLRYTKMDDYKYIKKCPLRNLSDFGLFINLSARQLYIYTMFVVGTTFI